MDPPRFRLPLNFAILDDPAFSPDPRSHPLANAISYKFLPSKSTLPKPQPVLKPVSTNVFRKARMKAFVCRLTARHDLDRIDELDESDPFGANFHHDGPYEAIVSNLAQPTLPRPAPNMHPSKGESDPLPLRSREHQSAHPLPPSYDETGLSLHLQPGQILQSNTIYSSYPPRIAATPGPFLPLPNTISAAIKPVPSRHQSLPSPLTLPYQGPSSGDLRDGLQSRQSSSRRERYPRGSALDALHDDRDAPPYTRRQTSKTIIPPPRYESRLHPSGPPKSPRAPPPSVNPVPPQMRSIRNVVPSSRHDSQHETIHLPHSFHSVRDRITQPSVQSKPLDPPRIQRGVLDLVPPFTQPSPTCPFIGSFSLVRRLR